MTMIHQEKIEQLADQAVNIIENGGVVILPADTVYGIYGSAVNEDAINRVYAIKGRKRGKPFGIVSTKSKVTEVVELNDVSLSIIDNCWPAPISIIAQKKGSAIPEFFSGDEPGLLVVCAQNRLLAKVAENCRVPIFSTTCNLAGEDEAKTPSDLDPFRTLVDFVAENDFFEFEGNPSTIVNAMGERPTVIREGAYPTAKLEASIDGISVNTQMLIQ